MMFRGSRLDQAGESRASFTVISPSQLFGNRALCRDMLRVRNAARCTHVIRSLSKNANITRLDRARTKLESSRDAVQPWQIENSLKNSSEKT